MERDGVANIRSLKVIKTFHDHFASCNQLLLELLTEFTNTRQIVWLSFLMNIGSEITITLVYNYFT